MEVLDFNEVFAPYGLQATLSSVPEWYVLGGHCSACKRSGWVDRYGLKHKHGPDTKVHQLQPRLRCLVCGNKGSNRWIAMKLPR